MASNGSPKNAIELLKKDHEEVEQLLDELTDTTERATKRRSELLKEIERLLQAHTKIEEELFYPALEKAATDKEQRALVAEAREEHRAVDSLVLPDLDGTDPGEIQFRGRAKVLKELVTHHAEEEEDEMFSVAKKLLSKDELKALGARMQERKEELLNA